VLNHYYASSEQGFMTHLRPKEHDLARGHLLGSCGRPVRGVEIEIRDESGRVAATGQVGEAYARGGMVMEGYWAQPEQTSALIQGGWSRTGDLAYQDEGGYLYLVGRAKGVIVTGVGSDNVYSRLLDDFARRLPRRAGACLRKAEARPGQARLDPSWLKLVHTSAAAGDGWAGGAGGHGPAPPAA
jgi:fatty-acyl-CoA synthase